MQSPLPRAGESGERRWPEDEGRNQGRHKAPLSLLSEPDDRRKHAQGLSFEEKTVRAPPAQETWGPWRSQQVASGLASVLNSALHFHVKGKPHLRISLRPAGVAPWLSVDP